MRGEFEMGDSPQSRRIIMKIFSLMNDYCNKEGMSLVVLLVPTREQVLGVQSDDFIKTFMQFTDTQGINAINLMPVMKGRKDLNFIIDSHWNRKGHIFIGDLLYNYLTKKLLGTN